MMYDKMRVGIYRSTYERLKAIRKNPVRGEWDLSYEHPGFLGDGWDADVTIAIKTENLSKLLKIEPPKPYYKHYLDYAINKILDEHFINSVLDSDDD